MASWKIHVLGTETAMSVSGRRFPLPEIAWTLFGCLLSSPRRSINRVKLASELWPDSNEDAARRCLATSLWRIKKRLPCFDALVISQGDRVSLADSKNVWIDAVVFEHRAQRALTDRHWLDGAANRKKLRRALHFYGGELLVRQDHEMIMIERERLRALYLDASFQLAHATSQHGEWHDTLEICRALCVVEPLREDAQRLLIEAYAACGNRALAIQQYHDLQQLLSVELAVRPMRETREVVERISRVTLPTVMDSGATNRALLIEARQQMMQTLGLIDQALTQIRS